MQRLNDKGAGELCIGAETALLVWRAVREGRIARPALTDATRVPEDCVTSLRLLGSMRIDSLGVTMTSAGLFAQYEERVVAERRLARDDVVRRLLPRGIATSFARPMPLHLLCARESQRHGHPAVKAHLTRGELPVGSLYRISEGILVACPELAFAQSCLLDRDLPNIELANELCGRYALGPAGAPCTFDLEPLVSKSRLVRYLAELGGRKRSTAAQRALRWAVDDLASPRECEVYLLLVLPPESGGYGFAPPQVNVCIPVSGSEAQALSAADHYEVDLLWPERNVILEYDGYDDHESDEEKVALDKERRSVLAAMGYTVIVVTKRDLRSAVRRHAKVAQLALALGVDVPELAGESLVVHESLVRWLCNPLHDHLPFGCGYH